MRGDSRPIPDPTTLTTDALDRLESVLDERVTSLRAIVDEKVGRIDSTLKLIDDQRLESKSDSKEALSAALVSQKDSAEKAEKATGRQFDSFVTRFGTVLDEVRRELGLLENRIGTMEAIKLGSQEQTDKSSQTLGFWVGGFGLISSIIAIILVVGDVLTH